MLGKLFKYDMKALARPCAPIAAAIVVVAALAAVGGYVGYSAAAASYSARSTFFETAIVPMAFFVMAMGMLTLCMAPVAVLIVSIYRFYKNLFTDEGYLTHTLPARPSQIVLAKTLSGFLFLLAVTVLAGFGLQLVSSAAEGFLPSGFRSSVPYWILSFLGGDMFMETGFPSLVIGAFKLMVDALFWLLVAYAAFALGATLAARHKVAASIGLCLLFMWLYGLLSGIFSVSILSWASYSSGVVDYGAVSMLLSLLSWIVSLAVSAGCYALCVHLAGRKLNLP